MSAPDGLRSADARERVRACVALRSDPSAIAQLDALIGALGDDEREVARAAAETLAGLQEAEVTNRLLHTLADGSEARRFGAAFALQARAPGEAALLPVFEEALGSRDRDRRWAASRALTTLAAQQPAIHAVLCRCARSDPRAEARRMACYTLRGVRPDRVETRDALLHATHDRDRAARRAALTALAALESPDGSVWARLERVLASSEADAAARRIATAVVASLAGRAAVPVAVSRALEACLEAPDAALSRGAARALRDADAASRALP